MFFRRPGRFKNALGQYHRKMRVRNLKVANKKIEETSLILGPYPRFLAMSLPTCALAVLNPDFEIGNVRRLSYR